MIKNMYETMLSITNAPTVIRSYKNGAERFRSGTSINKDGKLTRAAFPPGTLAFTDYHEWSRASKSKGAKAQKAITLKGNLIYIILP